MEKNKTFAWIPLMTKDKELVWLKHLNVEQKYFEHSYSFMFFGGLTSIEISYNRNVFSKIK